MGIHPMSIHYTNNHHIPLPLAVFLATDNYDHDPTDRTVSATKIMKPLRSLALGHRVPASDTVVDLMSQTDNRMGGAVHDAIENCMSDSLVRQEAMQKLGYPQSSIDRIHINPTAQDLIDNPDLIPIYLEVRHRKPITVDGIDYVLTGKSDYIAEGVVEDYKRTKTFNYNKPDKLAEYQLQASIYRWLNPEVIYEDFMRVHQMFTNWQQSLTFGEDYPNHPIETTQIPLLSMQQTEAYLVEKLRAVAQYKDAPQETIPLCTPKELWQNDPTYKYYSNPNKITGRSTKNFSSSLDAHTHMASVGKGVVLEVFGKAKACPYCPAFPICSQKDDLIKSGVLIIK